MKTQYFSPENRAVYEIMWKNVVEPGRRQITIRCMRIACWITNATITDSEYVIIFVFGYTDAHQRYVRNSCNLFVSFSNVAGTLEESKRRSKRANVT